MGDPIWSRLQTHGRHDSAADPGAGEPGWNQLLQSTDDQARRLYEYRQGWSRPHQHSGRRQADAEPAPLRDLSALAAVAVVPRASRSRRSTKAQARVLL